MGQKIEKTKGQFKNKTEGERGWSHLQPKSAGYRIEDKYDLEFRQHDHAGQIKMVKEGIAISSFENLCRMMNISSETLSGVINVASRTLARRRKEGHLHQDESERLLRIEILFNRAMEVLGGIEQARQWMMISNQALAGQTPLQYADTEPGAREVEDLLGRIEYGVCS